MARLRDAFGHEYETGGPPTKEDQGGGRPPVPGADPNIPDVTPPPPPGAPGAEESRAGETPRERVAPGGSSTLRVPPPAALPGQLPGGGLGQIGQLLGGQATPARPRTPTPLTASGPATFYGSLDPGASGLFGAAGGLLEGGLGAQQSAATPSDISSLIQTLLSQKAY